MAVGHVVHLPTVSAHHGTFFPPNAGLTHAVKFAVAQPRWGFCEARRHLFQPPAFATVYELLIVLFCMVE